MKDSGDESGRAAILNKRYSTKRTDSHKCRLRVHLARAYSLITSTMQNVVMTMASWC